MRIEVLLREITTEEIWQEVQVLRNELQTHSHLASGSQPLNGIITGNLQSGNYVTGSAGWTIKQDGSAEFTDLAVSAANITGTLDASVVNVVNLNASNISTGTLTGRTVRTSSGATRVEMASDNTLTIYQDGVARVGLSAGAIGFATSGGVGSASIAGIGTNKLGIQTGAYAYYLDEAAFYPSVASTLDVGAVGAEFQNVYADAYPASPIQVSKSGIEVFKKITKIAHTGDKYTLETEDLPKEFKITDKKGREHTELKRTVGLCVQGIMELIEKVEILESKIN